MDFKKIDAIPWWEYIYEETVLKFLSEGLPLHEVTVIDHAMFGDGVLLLNWPTIKGFDPSSYFGYINMGGFLIPVDIGPIPRFKQRKIKEDDRFEEYISETGARFRRFKKTQDKVTWYTMPLFFEFPVKDKKSWETYKVRLNPEDPRRRPKDWEKDGYCRKIDEYQNGPTLLEITGFYGFGAELMGILDFNLAFYKDPELIKDMLNHWEYFTIEALRETIETLQNRIDLVLWWEDIAEKHGPHISPNLFKKFMLPHYKNVINFLNKNKIHRIMLDSDGNTQPILDQFIEAGITGHWPLEVNSGMDVRILRKRFGTKLFLAGNLNKIEIAKGGQAMRKEIDSKLPMMKETGGYIAGIDHHVHVEFTLETFKEYADYLKKRLPL